jgi:hypothetical protein
MKIIPVLGASVICVFLTISFVGIVPSETLAQGTNATNTTGHYASSPDLNFFNLAIAGDWGCTDNTHKTIKNIIDKDPEVVLADGDLSYNDSPDCWFEEIFPFESQTKISIGNHDDEESGSAELRAAYMTHFN